MSPLCEVVQVQDLCRSRVSHARQETSARQDRPDRLYGPIDHPLDRLGGA